MKWFYQSDREKLVGHFILYFHDNKICHIILFYFAVVTNPDRQSFYYKRILYKLAHNFLSNLSLS